MAKARTGTCIDCGVMINQKAGRGRPRLRCDSCRNAWANRPVGATPRRSITCAMCDKPLAGGVRRPQGIAKCTTCRRLPAPPRLLCCATCGRMFEKAGRVAKYCGRECSPWTKGAKVQTAAMRGYDQRHRQLRRAFAVLVARGTECCCICSDPIDPNDAWDLDHTDDRQGWRGVAHSSCNRSLGAQARSLGDAAA